MCIYTRVYDGRILFGDGVTDERILRESMKHLHIPLEDKDYNRLKRLKGRLTWHEFVMKAAECFKEQKK